MTYEQEIREWLDKHASGADLQAVALYRGKLADIERERKKPLTTIPRAQSKSSEYEDDGYPRKPTKADEARIQQEGLENRERLDMAVLAPRKGWTCTGGDWGGCGKVFRSLSGFEAHRVGTFDPSTRRCMTDAEMKAAKFVLTNGFWGRIYGGRRAEGEGEGDSNPK